MGTFGYFGYNWWSSTHPAEADNPGATTQQPSTPSTNPGSTTTPSTTPVGGNSTSIPGNVINLSLDEWIGWKPIIDANQGLTTQPGSIFDNLGLQVNLSIINDGAESSNAMITGDLNAAGYTTNRTAFLSTKFNEAGVDIVMPVFTNYSAGGDGIICKEGINNVSDLIGKTIGVPRFSEAQTLVIWFVNKSDLTESEKQGIIDNMVLFDDAEQTGEAFFAGQLDVAATWEPYLSMAAEQAGSKILFDTRASKSLIMDGIVFRTDWAEANPDSVTKFIDGVFQANSMYETEFKYIKEVMPMFAGASDADILDQCSGAELMGYAENKEVLDTTAPSVYADMCTIWQSIGEEANSKMAMTLFDTTYLLPLSSSYSNTKLHDDKPVEMTADRQEVVKDAQALLTKTMTVEFVPDTAKFLDPDSAYAIMDDFIAVAQTLDGAILQIEGNINSSSAEVAGVQLSLERANAVAKYFIASGIDPNRIITVGNGNTKMVVPANSADATMNRRTDVFFKILEE
ncbi:MAG: phosphate ABC transporter substrate-binding/OmpA family protein [Lachnospiraceae bacterium]|nr:phosphate ABC transporter substrate-binding/OmpA family protein [Lachnospiraceae bacterium]